MNKEEISNYKGTVYLCTECFKNFTDKQADSFDGFTKRCPYCKCCKCKIIHTGNPSDLAFINTKNKFSY